MKWNYRNTLIRLMKIHRKREFLWYVIMIIDKINIDEKEAGAIMNKEYINRLRRMDN